MGTAYGKDRTGHEKLLILCPDIAPDTLLHYSRQGDSYRLRAFNGRLADPDHPGSAGYGAPFHALHPETGQKITDSDEFERTYSFTSPIDVRDEGISLDQKDRWRDLIARRNTRLGIGARD